MSKEIGHKVIPFKQIEADSGFNCRGAFHTDEIIDLAENIRVNGLVQKCAVRILSEDKYQLVAGFRRMAAMKYLNMTEATFIVWEMTELEATVINLVENIERKELNIDQEAEAINKLYTKLHLQPREIERFLKRGSAWVTMRMEYYYLAPEAKKLIVANKIPKQDINKLFRIQTKLGHEHLLSALRECQDALDQKRKPQIVGNKNYKVKHPRTKVEIERMLLQISESIPFFVNNDHMEAMATLPRVDAFWPKCMAWAAGNITTEELFESAITFANAMGIEYKPPFDFAKGM